MVKTYSAMRELGTQALEFSLPNVLDDQLFRYKLQAGHPATVIMFLCNHCPYVKHIMPCLLELAREYIAKNIAFIAINANDVTQYPDDSPIHMKALAEDDQYPFPYLFDETQEVARAYGATCTPDFFVFGKDDLLIYRGQFDDARPGNAIPVTGQALKDALDNQLQGLPIQTIQKPSIGCNIKWKTV